MPPASLPSCDGGQAGHCVCRSHANAPRGDPLSFIINDMPDSVQDLLARFQLKIKEFRIRVREFLRDFDLLRLGKITQSQFRSGLSIAKLPLSDTEFRFSSLYH